MQESMPKDPTNITSLQNVHKDCYHKVRNFCSMSAMVPCCLGTGNVHPYVACIVPNAKALLPLEATQNMRNCVGW